MDLGNKLYRERKRMGFSQEEIAEKIGVTRQTISKWETNETVPDVKQAKKMVDIYNIKLDELMKNNSDIKEIQSSIDKIDNKVQEKINWTNVWSKKYPILSEYQSEVDINKYAVTINIMLDELKKSINLMSKIQC